MGPDDVKAARKDLGCTARELGAALGVDQETVLAWERGDLFPTKRHVDALAKLREQGPSAIPRRPRGAAAKSPMALLADPALWRLVRKLLVHAELRSQVEKLAERYDDPTDG